MLYKVKMILFCTDSVACLMVSTVAQDEPNGESHYLSGLSSFRFVILSDELENKEGPRLELELRAPAQCTIHQPRCAQPVARGPQAASWHKIDGSLSSQQPTLSLSSSTNW